MLGQYRYFRSVPVLRLHTVQVLVPQLWVPFLDTRVLVQGFQGVICIFLILVLSSVPFWYHFSSSSGGTKSFGIGTSIDWNLNYSKFSVPKCKSCNSFGVFGSSPTLPEMVFFSLKKSITTASCQYQYGTTSCNQHANELDPRSMIRSLSFPSVPCYFLQLSEKLGVNHAFHSQ